MKQQCPMQRPPCAKGWPLLGSLPAIYRDAIDAFRRMRSTYGDVVQFRLPFERAYLVSCPHLIQEALVRKEFSKGKYYKRLETAFGQGLLTATGDKWRRQRKLLQPFFQHENIKSWQPIINQCTSDMLTRWEQKAAHGESVDAVVEMRELLQRIMSQIMFGSEISGELALRAARSISIVNDNIFAELIRTTIFHGPLKAIRTPGMTRYQSAIDEFNDIIDQCLSQETSFDGDHMLAHFRRARYVDTGEPMDAKQFRDEVATFFFAGQETTANALGWALYALSQNSDDAEKIAAEVQNARIMIQSNYDEYNVLRYVENVAKEVLRLYPPAYGIERHADKNVVLGGQEIEGDSLVVVAPSVVHMHPDYWDDPETFHPERFEQEQQKSRPPNAFLPFGAGARKCIGIQLAMMEMRTVLAHICSHFLFELLPGAKVKPRIGLTQKPHPSVPLKLTKIQGDLSTQGSQQ